MPMKDTLSQVCPDDAAGLRNPEAYAYSLYSLFPYIPTFIESLKNFLKQYKPYKTK